MEGGGVNQAEELAQSLVKGQKGGGPREGPGRRVAGLGGASLEKGCTFSSGENLWALSETLGREGAGVLQKWGLRGGADLDPDPGVDPSGGLLQLPTQAAPPGDPLLT